MPISAEINQFYENYYKTSQYTAKLESKIRRARRRIKGLKRTNGQRFLDVGCNVGFATEAARQIGFQAEGIDLDPVAIDTARKLFPEARFSTDDLDHLAMKNERYDVVYCSEIIEHLTDPDAFLSSVKSVMTDGATLFLTTPDAGHYRVSQKPEHLCDWNNVRPPEHLLYFNGRSIRCLLSNHGFNSIHIAFNLKPTLKVRASR
ncbi:MAG: class I SAM-dependent methyltransferase [Rhodomicrobiaceae bacterium]